jgi:replicative DNA helicase
MESGQIAVDPTFVGVPSNTHAERMILGAILMADKKTLPQVAAVLAPEDFHLAAHQLIYRTMVDLYNEGRGVDRVTVSSELIRKGEIDDVGGMSYVTALDDGLPELYNVPEYAAIVKEKATLRGTMQVAQAMTNMVLIEQRTSKQIVEYAEQQLLGLYRSAMAGDDIETPGQIVDACGGLDGFLTTDLIGALDSPWSDLSKATGWIRPGHLILVAARPGMGKTVVGLNWAAYLARRYGPVDFHSLEMDKGQLVKRLISAKTKIDFSLIDNGMSALSPDERERVRRAEGEIMEMPIRLLEDKGYSVMGIRSQYLRRKEKDRPVAIFIDYLQLMRGVGAKKSRNEEVGEISRGLKALARELRVPIIALVQLSRAPESVEGGIPELHHMRESGDLEQDADKVIMLHRPEMYSQNPGPDVQKRIDMYVRKNRQGILKRIECNWYGFCQLIQNRRLVASSDPTAPVVVEDVPEADFDQPIQMRMAEIMDTAA